MGKVGLFNGNWRRVYAANLIYERNAHAEYLVMSKQKMASAYWQQRWSNALDCLRTEDPQGWEAWYDNDNNVPAESNNRKFATLVEARVKELTGELPYYRAQTRRGIFIWEDQVGFFVFSKEVGKEPLYVIEFSTFEAAETFLKGLPIDNCGYGFVLDILPASVMEVHSNSIAK